MVNHFNMTDDQLLDHLVDLVECSVEIEYSYADVPELEYNIKRNKEYWDIRKELLERMKK